LKQIEVAIAVVIRQGLVLICQRRAEDAFGQFWEFPGGKREAGETIEQCLLREMTEELNLPVRITAGLPPIAHQYPDVHVTLFPFLCTCSDGNQPQALASRQILWVSPAQLADYPFPAANAALIQWLLEHPPRTSTGYLCPHCRQPVQCDGVNETATIQCPHCGQAFLAVAAVDLQAEAERELSHQQQLDALRIQRQVKERRAAMRSASHCLIVALACIVGALDLLWQTIHRYWVERRLGWPALYLAAAIVLGWGGVRFLRRARRLSRESRRHDLPEPTAAPDFSTLGDGSQAAKNLEQIH
jgi:8-oxo-dGTP diphosphatase